MADEAGGMGRLREIVGTRWRDALLGGITFWLPDFLYHYFARSEPSTNAMLLLTLIMPSAVTAAYFLAKRNAARRASRAWSILIGIWCLGPTMIMLGQTYEGAGFRNIRSVPYWAVASVFPPLTLVMAGFDLSIFALLLATTSLLLLYWLVEWRGRQSPLHN